MVRAVVFDFGNVISAFDYMSFFRQVAPGTNRSPEELAAIFRESGIHREYERGAVTSDRFYAATVERLGLSVGKTEFFAAYTDIFTPSGPRRT